MVSRLHRALLRDLWHLRGQVLATSIVVACGIAAFVAMRSTYDSLLAARAHYYEQYRFAQVFAHLKRGPTTLYGSLRDIPGVAALELRVVEDVTLTVPGLAEPARGRLISIAGAQALNALCLLAGRLPERGQSAEIVASDTFARANSLSIGSHIGAVLNGRWKELTIVGLALSPEYVYEVDPGMVFPDNRRFGVLWMEADGLAAAFDMKGAFNDVSLSLAHGASGNDVIDAVDRVLRLYGGLSAVGRDEQPSNRFLADELGEIEVNATYLPAIFLAVAAFLVYTLLARIVSIQRGQIALLKAFGHANFRIALHFLEFGLAIVAAGVLLGTLLGAYLGEQLIGVYRGYFHFPQFDFRLPVSVVLWAAVIAAAAAILGSLAAVTRAVRLPPAEAMRPEPPRSYHAGLLERAGVIRWLGKSGRVIVRNIARRPVRAALSVLGIGAAVATVVLGRFTFDAVNHLMAVHFDTAQREDALVTFAEARPPTAIAGFAHLPGVMRAEGFRAIPVRLRAGYLQKRTTLLGVPADSEMRQLVDAARQPIGMPPAGLVLTRKLATLLGVQPGDVIDVEQLDGRRLGFQETVVRLSDEPLGISAYMDSGALARRLGETDAVSGALLQVDHAQQQAVYDALKRMPAVAGVAVRSAMLQTISDTMNRSFILMTFVLTGFAMVLVVGVVYNSARIALSERGHELASLRVLGFNRPEVALLLLGEQALLTLAAIPLGLGLGVLVCRMLVPLFDRELFRLPFVLTSATFGFATLVTLAAAALSAALVGGRIAHLDLVGVLKSRE